MATFIFIVQGEGRGHLSQSVALKEYLEEGGHVLKAVFTGCNQYRSLPAYFLEDFKEKVHCFASPFFLRTPNKKGIYIGRTLLFNAFRSFRYFSESRRIRREILRLEPDFVVNFYDVVGALSMRKLPAGIRRIGIGHHFTLHLEGYPCGMRKPFHNALLRLHTRIIMSGCDRILALSFREFSGSHLVRVVPPLVRKQFRRDDYQQGKDYLVYFLNEGYVLDLIKLVRDNPGLSFDVFSDLPMDTPVPEGIRLHRVDDTKFYEKMMRCKAVITTAGFDTAAEAASAGIPLAVLPVENHYEQYCNSSDVKRSGIGIVLKSLTLASLAEMTLADQKKYRAWVAGAGTMILKELDG